MRWTHPCSSYHRLHVVMAKSRTCWKSVHTSPVLSTFFPAIYRPCEGVPDCHVSTCKLRFHCTSLFFIYASLSRIHLPPSHLRPCDFQAFCEDVSEHDFLFWGYFLFLDFLIFNGKSLCAYASRYADISRTSDSGACRSRAADECEYLNQMTAICYLRRCCCCADQKCLQEHEAIAHFFSVKVNWTQSIVLCSGFFSFFLFLLLFFSTFLSSILR